MVKCKGTSGSRGTSGSAGTSGTRGTSGSSGSSGTAGTSGSSGSSGTSGSSGSSGSSGTSGSSGSSGTSGSSGAGTSGTSGAAGENGTAGTSGLGAGLLALPVPKVFLDKEMGGNKFVNIDTMDPSTGTAYSSVQLYRAPVISVSDISSQLFSSCQIFVEMVHYRRASRRIVDPNGARTYKKRSGFVATPDYYWDATLPGQVWRMPWSYYGVGIGVRATTPMYTPGGITSLQMTRPNWYEATYEGQRINVYEYFNSRFYPHDIKYRDTTGTEQSLANVLIPTGASAPTGGNNPSTRYAYSSRYTPLYVAFRYIAYVASTGEIVSGPLSRVLKITHQKFPFKYEYEASSLIGLPCVSIAGYDNGKLQCYFETSLP